MGNSGTIILLFVCSNAPVLTLTYSTNISRERIYETLALICPNSWKVWKIAVNRVIGNTDTINQINDWENDQMIKYTLKCDSMASYRQFIWEILTQVLVSK